jgi:hypothetical protein
VLLVIAETGTAATLKARYSLQGSLASDIAGAPSLVDLGAGNRFALEQVGNVQRQVRTFPVSGGLSLATTGLVDPSAHSVVMTFRLDQRPGYRRLLDFTQGMSDNGLYDLNGRAVLYVDGNLATSRVPVIGSSYVQVALTSWAVTGGLLESVYVNGAPVASGTVTEGFGLSSGALRFFKDNASGGAGGEEAAGAVACVLVYDGTLSADEVRQVAADASLCPAATENADQPRATVSSEPRVLRRGRSIVADTGLRVTCPVGASPCRATGQVGVAPGSRRYAGRRLGSAEFAVSPGETRRVVVPLSARGAKRLRKAHKLRIKAAAAIVTTSGATADASRTGTIAAPRRPLFRTGVYSGTTGQGLPIFISTTGDRIVTVFFRWRATCADGRVHTGVTLLHGKRVRRERFVIGRRLRNGGSARVSGKIDRYVASGTLARRGPTAFKTTCVVDGVTWRAPFAPIEAGSVRLELPPKRHIQSIDVATSSLGRAASSSLRHPTWRRARR